MFFYLQLPNTAKRCVRSVVVCKKRIRHPVIAQGGPRETDHRPVQPASDQQKTHSCAFNHCDGLPLRFVTEVQRCCLEKGVYEPGRKTNIWIEFACLLVW